MNKLLLLLLLVLFTVGRMAGQTTDTLRGTPSYTVFLMGDAGAPALDGTDPNLNTMRTQMQAAGRNSAVVYLGDNIYQRGLPDPDKPDRPVAERKIAAQLDILKNYPGRPFFTGVILEPLPLVM